MVRIGDPDRVCFEVLWDGEATGSAAEVTRGGMGLCVAGEYVWGEDGAGESWTWVELLEWLAISWNWLRWEEGLPLDVQDRAPGQVRSELELRWDDMPRGEAQREKEAFWTWVQTHDLARAVGGLRLPSVFVLREGLMHHVLSDESSATLPSGELLEVLGGVGDAISDRLRAGQLDARGRAALEDWERREALATEPAAVIYTGLSRERLEEVLPGGLGGGPGTFEPNEVLAAARMLGALRPSVARSVLEQIRTVQRIDTPALNALSQTWRAQARELGRNVAPYAAGYSLAGWLRDQLSLAPRAPVEPREILEAWGVPVLELQGERAALATIDAVSCWGPSHGPAILFNGRSARHLENPVTERISLAHEICHLVADRSGRLPLAEVLAGRAKPVVEKRARAFAAEFLLPRVVAGERFRTVTRASDVDSAVFGLAEDFGVSRSVVAWQVLNAEPEVPAFVRDELRWVRDEWSTGP